MIILIKEFYFFSQIYTPKHNYNIYNYRRFENICMEAQVVTDT
jgi:hypothetical protein